MIKAIYSTMNSMMFCIFSLYYYLLDTTAMIDYVQQLFAYTRKNTIGELTDLFSDEPLAGYVDEWKMDAFIFTCAQKINDLAQTIHKDQVQFTAAAILYLCYLAFLQRVVTIYNIRMNTEPLKSSEYYPTYQENYAVFNHLSKALEYEYNDVSNQLDIPANEQVLQAIEQTANDLTLLWSNTLDGYIKNLRKANSW